MCLPFLQNYIYLIDLSSSYRWLDRKLGMSEDKTLFTCTRTCILFQCPLDNVSCLGWLGCLPADTEYTKTRSRTTKENHRT